MNIIVTGASKGIGKEIVKRCLGNTNHKVIAISRNRKLLKNLVTETNNNIKLNIISYDINDILFNDSTIIDKISSYFSKVDILINNAGLLINRSFETSNYEKVKSMFETNFFASAELIRLLIPYLSKPSLSHVVNIGSMAGFQGSSKFSGLAFYSASKAALASLTECLAQEYSKSNIKFNCLALGAVNTEMLNEAFPGYKAPLNAKEIADFVVNFSINSHKYLNGKIIPVSLTDPS